MPPEPPANPPAVNGQPAAQPAKAAPEKTVSFAFEDKPWNQVIDWFAKESGLVFISTAKPTGSVTIKTDPTRKYTIREVVDLLNEALSQQKYVLIRRSQSFTVWPACEEPPPRGVTGTPSARQAASARSASFMVRGVTTPSGMIW